MLALREMQRAFARAVLADDDAPLAALIRAAEIGAAGRIRIYRNNNRAGLLQALETSYPVVAQLGGEDWFRQTVAHYGRAHPSRCGDMQYAGERFPQFLRVQLTATPHEYFADVANLEWAYQEVLVAGDCSAVGVEALRGVAPVDYARLELIPRRALRLVQSRYPIHSIWSAHQSASGELAIDLGAGASRVLIIRRADHVELRELADASYALLERCVAGDGLGRAVDHVAAELADFDLERALQELFRLQVFRAIRLGSTSHPSHVSVRQP